MSEQKQVKVEVGQVWEYSDRLYIVTAYMDGYIKWARVDGSWNADICDYPFASEFDRKGWILVSLAPATVPATAPETASSQGTPLTREMLDRAALETRAYAGLLQPSDLRVGMVFEITGVPATLRRRRGNVGWEFEEGGWSTFASICAARLISAPAEVVCKNGGFTGCGCEDCWDVRSPAQHFNSIGTVGKRWEAPKPQPSYAVGDRFAHADGRFAEVVALTNKEIQVRVSAKDEVYESPNTKDICSFGFLTGFTHVSGPTYRAPSKVAVPQCNCSAQVTGSIHRPWCRTQGGV